MLGVLPFYCNWPSVLRFQPRVSAYAGTGLDSYMQSTRFAANDAARMVRSQCFVYFWQLCAPLGDLLSNQRLYQQACDASQCYSHLRRFALLPTALLVTHRRSRCLLFSESYSRMAIQSGSSNLAQLLSPHVLRRNFGRLSGKRPVTTVTRTCSTLVLHHDGDLSCYSANTWNKCSLGMQTAAKGHPGEDITLNLE